MACYRQDSSCGSSSAPAPQILDCLPKGAIPIHAYREMAPYIHQQYCPPKNYCPPRGGHVSGTKLDITVPVNPLTDVRGLDSGLTNGNISIMVRRKNEAVTFAWESFTGQIGGKGIDHVYLGASIGNFPKFTFQMPIRVKVNSKYYVGYLYVDPCLNSEKIKFHFNYSDDISVSVGDTLTVFGGAATWVTC